MRFNEEELSSLQRWVGRTAGPVCQADPDVSSTVVTCCCPSEGRCWPLLNFCHGELN